MPQSVMVPFVRKSPLVSVDCVAAVLVPAGAAFGVAGVVDVPGIGMEDPGVWPLFVFTPLLVAAVDESFFIVSSSIS